MARVPPAASAIAISSLELADLEPVREILRASGLTVDLEAELSRSFAVKLVARLEGRRDPAGFLLAWRAADELHLTDLGTLPAFRRRGVARALVSALVSQGRADGARIVVLELRRSNEAALGLYRSLGFAVAGERKAYYSDNGEDAVEMRLDLR